MEAAGGGAAYFRRSRLCWCGLILGSFGYYTWVVFWPQSIPYQKLGSLGLFTRYLVDNHLELMYYGYWVAWLIHVGEAIYALILCKFNSTVPSQPLKSSSKVISSTKPFLILSSQKHSFILLEFLQHLVYTSLMTIITFC
ncbi:transmembrane protein 254 isoform X1 [Macrotis lagotis]|uniref:transmembrane protein 254 isoform X1 n=1 Tax=Macrotis lagotis TaxID=92651 RepID=UPI003D6919AB